MAHSHCFGRRDGILDKRGTANSVVAMPACDKRETELRSRLDCGGTVPKPFSGAYCRGQVLDCSIVFATGRRRDAEQSMR
jgi:hypothetical protein